MKFHRFMIPNKLVFVTIERAVKNKLYTKKQCVTFLDAFSKKRGNKKNFLISKEILPLYYV
jgi:hypothetical protein